MPDPQLEDDDAPGRSRRHRTRRRSWARRRHLGLLTTGIALVVLVAGLLIVLATWDHGRPSFAAQVASAAGPSSSAAPSAPTTSAPVTSTAPSTTGTATGTGTTGTVASSTVRGKITVVGSDRWTVAATNGLNYTVVVTPATTFTRNKVFGDFGVGDGVTAKGTLDDGVVTALTVAPAKGA